MIPHRKTADIPNYALLQTLSLSKLTFKLQQFYIKNLGDPFNNLI